MERTDVKPSLWDRLSHVLSGIHIKGVVRTSHSDALGAEVVGINGRFVYFRWNDKELTWEAYDNDGTLILKAQALADSKWESKVERMLRDTLERTRSKDRDSHNSLIFQL